MMGYKMTSGTCLVSNLYETFTELMIAAGWQNISSKPATDYDVWYSPGEQGDKRLIIQTRKESNGNLGHRFIADYTPGAAGTAGIIQRTTAAWRSVSFFSHHNVTSFPQSNQVNYKYHANKDRIIFYCEANHSTGTMYNGIIYLGLSDVRYRSESGSRGLYLLNSNYGSNSFVSDYIDGVTASTDALTTRMFFINPYGLSSTFEFIKSPDESGNYILLSYYVGDNITLRGKLSGIYLVHAKNAVHGDVIKVGTRSFQLIRLTKSTINSNEFLSSSVQEYTIFLAFEV
jgi:hypothetical protein